ncbi:hypothetical protein B0A55_13090 [Friedmanniomyces simplex]|uniref:F-box domain-containing protein n=1 Tax=Friedmanniomyces simplex TaxID=329884 RepID=A0A4U0VGL6_9PEZI|nr:hypothetical protein B0A55_13090 [Friedmanniomyces simplex]
MDGGRKSEAATEVFTPDDITAPSEASATKEVATPNRFTATEDALDRALNATPFRFLDLPAELRMWIYRELLAPTSHVSFRLRDKHTFGGVIGSSLNPAILRTSQQVFGEAKDILHQENNVCIKVDVWFGSRWMLSDGPVAPASLPRFESLMLLLLVGHGGSLATGSHANVDWRVLQAMTGLRRVSVAYIDEAAQRNKVGTKKALLTQVVERLPADCDMQ